MYDYAVGGVGVDDIPQQLHRHFLPTVGQRPEWAPWTAANSLFGRVPDSLLWALSDVLHSNLDRYQRSCVCSCGVTNTGPTLMMSCRFHGESAYIRQKLETLFKQEDALYKAGARNFLFIDVPPIQLSPAGMSLLRKW